MPQGQPITVNPDEIHDGMSADKSEYCYRVLFTPHDLLQKIGSEMVAAGTSHYFRLPVTEDAELAGKLTCLFQLLEQDHMELLEAQSLFYQPLGCWPTTGPNVSGCRISCPHPGKDRQGLRIHSGQGAAELLA